MPEEGTWRGRKTRNVSNISLRKAQAHNQLRKKLANFRIIDME
jgi:hypothetical protein